MSTLAVASCLYMVMVVKLKMLSPFLGGCMGMYFWQISVNVLNRQVWPKTQLRGGRSTFCDISFTSAQLLSRIVSCHVVEKVADCLFSDVENSQTSEP